MSWLWCFSYYCHFSILRDKVYEVIPQIFRYILTQGLVVAVAFSLSSSCELLELETLVRLLLIGDTIKVLRSISLERRSPEEAWLPVYKLVLTLSDAFDDWNERESSFLSKFMSKE